MMFVMIFYLISTQIASSASKKVSHPITISIEMKIEYISNFDFGKQTFDVIVEVEQSILQWIDIDKLQHDVGVGQTTSVFSDIQFDVIDSHTIGIVDYAVSRKNLTGMRKK
uniref:Fn3_like domain-containing protein n=1 Tax=Angiostrongylus cantonensis TaxID=6313 RepID=A0A0K0D2Z5_ANGCA